MDGGEILPLVKPHTCSSVVRNFASITIHSPAHHSFSDGGWSKSSLPEPQLVAPICAYLHHSKKSFSRGRTTAIFRSYLDLFGAVWDKKFNEFFCGCPRRFNGSRFNGSTIAQAVLSQAKAGNQPETNRCEYRPLPPVTGYYRRLPPFQKNFRPLLSPFETPDPK